MVVLVGVQSAGPEPVGFVLGTEDATPLDFWVAVQPGSYLQLDDVVALERVLPSGEVVGIFGVVSQVRARHEGARFDSDVFLIRSGVLPAEVVEAANITSTRFEPELFVPPIPGSPVRKAEGAEREQALYFDGMERRLPIGLSRDGQPVFANFDFMDGTRGAHVNISGISGVATKTSYACFLLYSLFRSKLMGGAGLNAKALIFNVKSEDLLFLDKPNLRLDVQRRARYESLGLPAGPFPSVEFWAPPRRNVPSAIPDVHGRTEGVTAFFWTLADFCSSDLLPFLFADAEDERAQYPIVLHNVMAKLRQGKAGTDGAVIIEGETCRTFRELVDLIAGRVDDDTTDWGGRAVTPGTRNAFIRRLEGAVRHIGHLIRADIPGATDHAIRFQQQVTVVDIHNLNDRAQRFVVGVILRQVLDTKERQGRPDPLQFVVLDELNKYAPREGSSPIKEILLDIAERGRSLGISLIGAEQTASEVERRIVANSSLRVVGRLDSAEAGREEYGFLPVSTRQRATILKPGTMVVSQPEIPVPLVIEFPFPAWATRNDEAGPAPGSVPLDPFDGLVEEPSQ
ncbi:MAG: ATPase [Anaerolinea sp.]|nr:ATPase [Anaerolinea sp.]